MAFEGVSIEPPLINLEGVELGVEGSFKIRVLNASSKSKKVKSYSQKLEVSRLVSKSAEYKLAPGIDAVMRFAFTLSYNREQNEEFIMQIGDSLVKVPIKISPTRPNLSIPSMFDFGSNVAKKNISQGKVKITNMGTGGGNFKIKKISDFPFNVSPLEGSIPPKSSQTLQLEMLIHNEGQYSEQIELEFDDKTVQLELKGEVVLRRLYFVEDGEKKITKKCLNFGNVYYGSTHVKTAYLANVSPEEVVYALILADDVVGQEIGVVHDTGGSDGFFSECPIYVTPKEGILKPYEVKKIEFSFSPRWPSSTRGFKSTERPFPIQEMVFFVKIKIPGEDSLNENNSVMSPMPIIGKAFPVQLSVYPLKEHNFGVLSPDEESLYTCTLTNRNRYLPIKYRFKRVANFVISPNEGVIKPRKKVSVNVIFSPNQIGIFSLYQQLKVLAFVCQGGNPFSLKEGVIDCFKFHLLGICQLKPPENKQKFNPGITPLITNEVGINCNPTFANAESTNLRNGLNLFHKSFQYKTKVRQLDYSGLCEANIAVPNDLAKSIAPFPRGTNYLTPFTLQKRHNYVDLDYAYTDKEILDRKEHDNRYIEFIHGITTLTKKTQLEKEFSKIDNNIDIGLEGMTAMKPPHLSMEDLGTDNIETKEESNVEFMLLSATKIKSMENILTVNEITKIKPKSEICRQLTAYDLCLIRLDPIVVDLGKICVHSDCSPTITVLNGLDFSVKITSKNDHHEVQNNDLLTAILPAKSKTFFPIDLHFTTPGILMKSIEYCINDQFRDNILLIGEIITPQLELSTRMLTIAPNSGIYSSEPMRGVVTIYNKLNVETEFNWIPITNADDTVSFSIRPAIGVVSAHSFLDCEVVHHSHYPHNEASFQLRFAGKSIEFKCKAKMGSSRVVALNNKIEFNYIPLYLKVTKTLYLHNTSHNPAFYEILDPFPIVDMIVTPTSGMIKPNEITEIYVSVIMQELHKFDCKLVISLQSSTNIEVRISGTSCQTFLEIKPDILKFDGVYVGSSLALPFTIDNKSQNEAKVDFHMSNYRDFSLVASPHKERQLRLNKVDNICTVFSQPDERMELSAVFHPTEIASYDFDIPISINGVFIKPRSRQSTRYSMSDNLPLMSPSLNITSLFISGTALKQPLSISTSTVEFVVTCKQLTDPKMTPISKPIFLTNETKESLEYNIDQTYLNLTENPVFGLYSSDETVYSNSTFSESIQSGETLELKIQLNYYPSESLKSRIDVYIKGHLEIYQSIIVSVVFKIERISFNPFELIIPTIPLSLEHSTKVSLFVTNYRKNSNLQVKLPELGDKTHFRVEFKRDNVIKESLTDSSQKIKCIVYFKSHVPISLFEKIMFVDDMKNCFPLGVVASADNSLFSCYSFLGEHQSGWYVGNPSSWKSSHESPSSAQRTATFGQISDTNSNATTVSQRSLNTSSLNTLRELTTLNNISDSLIAEREYLDMASDETDKPIVSDFISMYGFAFPIFCKNNFDYYTCVLNVVQTWFSHYSSPKGYVFFKIPESMQKAFSNSNDNLRILKSSKFGNYNSSILEVIQHICGRSVPGIPPDHTLPNDPNERVSMIYWIYQTLINFVKNQGGIINWLQPEYLMDELDFKLWSNKFSTKENKFFDQNRPLLLYSLVTEVSEELFHVLFHALARRAWLDLLLQILKILVFPKLQKYTVDFQNTTSDILTSNIFSDYECIPVNWINKIYRWSVANLWRKYSPQNYMYLESREVLNVEIDLKDSIILISVMLSYFTFLAEDIISQVKVRPSTSEEYFHNSLVLVKIMRMLSLEYDIVPIDILQGNQIIMILFCHFLYENLKNLTPRETVKFHSAFYTHVEKKIKITNPSRFTFTYTALITGLGSMDFCLKGQNPISIPPNSFKMLDIQFFARFVNHAEAKLYLIAKCPGIIGGSNIVINLEGSVSEIVPLGTINFSSPCYSWQTVEYNIRNPFSQDGNFKIQIISDYQRKYPIQRGSVHHLSEASKVSHQSKIKMKSFHCNEEVIFIDSGSTKSLSLKFLPLYPGKHDELLVLTCEDVGEIIYSLHGKDLNPLPMKVTAVIGSHSDQSNTTSNILHWKCEPNVKIENTLILPLYNQIYNKAICYLAQSNMSGSEYEIRKMTGTLTNKNLLSRTIKELNQQMQSCNHFNSKLFTVEVTDSRNFFCPKTIEVPLETRLNDFKYSKYNEIVSKEDELEEGILEVPISFFSKEIGQYSCKVKLKCNEDVRLFKIVCSVNPKGIQAKLEMHSPVQQSVVQNIPIINNSNNIWKLSSEIEGKEFSGPKQLTVKAGDSLNYQLTFTPLSKKTVTGKLTLINRLDNISHIFELVGFGEKSSALENIFINIQARTQVSKSLKVPNESFGRRTYNVETNIDFLSGLSRFTSLPQRNTNYNFTLTPMRRGLYKGIIQFTTCEIPIAELDSDGDDILSCEFESNTKNDSTIWYRMEINVDPPPPEKTLEIICPCQSKKSLQVVVTNPADYSMSFQVDVSGEDLYGLSEITIGGNQSSVYELEYVPLNIGNSNGSLIFYNSEIGEFWYEIVLTAENPLPIIIPPLRCEIGCWHEFVITIPNPTDETVNITPTVDNGNSYRIVDFAEGGISVPPNDSTDVKIIFIPRNIGYEGHSATINFQSKQFGILSYHVEAFGDVPGKQEILSVTSYRGFESTTFLPFRNPFDFPIKFQLKLSNEDEFKFSNKLISQLRTNEMVDIPITFTPNQLVSHYNSTLSVIVKPKTGDYFTFYEYNNQQMNQLESIEWTFPIEGVAISTNNGYGTSFIFTTPCRSTAERLYKIVLDHQNEPEVHIISEIEAERLILEWKDKPSIIEEFDYKWVSETNNLKYNCANIFGGIKVDSQDHIVMAVKFYCGYPIKYKAKLQLSKTNEKRWSLPFSFTATTPIVDDTIVIESIGLGKKSSVVFQLSSHNDNENKFHVYFEEGSDKELSVFPKTGILSPLRDESSEIYVTFHPQQYGRTKMAKLIIKTDEMMWLFDVVGKIPEYYPPLILPRVIKPVELVRRQPNVNYITKNINVRKCMAERRQMIIR